MHASEYATGEIASLGSERYERELRSRMEPVHRGRFLALNVESGDYEIADTLLDACDALHARSPDAPTYVVRIGHAGIYRLGGVNRVQRE